MMALVAGVSLVLGCGGSGSGASDPPDDPQAPGAVEQPASATARLKRKAPALLAADLGQALDLSRSALCRELARAGHPGHDCFAAHDVLLGGVEPYRLRIDEPLAATVAAPTAVDRIVLSACGERAARDFADPASAVLFGEVTGAAASDQARAAIAGRLYERLLARPAQGSEIDALVDLHAELGPGAQPRAWAQLACYAVATTTEFLFY